MNSSYTSDNDNKDHDYEIDNGVVNRRYDAKIPTNISTIKTSMIRITVSYRNKTIESICSFTISIYDSLFTTPKIFLSLVNK